MNFRYFLASVFLVASLQSAVIAGTGTLTINAGSKGPRIGEKMHGIFLEEINHGVDGGLYAELLRNRAFEGNNPPEGGRGKFTADPSGLPDWVLVQGGAAQGSMHADTNRPLSEATPHSLRLEVSSVKAGRIGVANGGFWGISVVKGEKYNFSVFARCDEDFKGPLKVTLESADGGLRCEAVTIRGIAPDWKEFKATLKGTQTDPKARLVITAGSPGKVWFDLVSLMPAKAWHGLPLRADIAQMIADLQPRFVRFPGGCVVEGYTPKDAYNWKETVGPLTQRKETFNAWDYRRTHGLGLYEYLRYIEEMKAQPMFVLFAGDSCFYRGVVHVPENEMQWVVDNYTDFLEYATGSPTSQWGSVRAKAGHPRPFGDPMIGIGNENWLDEYVRNYKVIQKTLKDRYPRIEVIAAIEKPGMEMDFLDQHHYWSARWFLNTQMYDKYDRKGPKVYCGEVASPNELTDGGYNIFAALVESVFMLHMEKNADVVRMMSYAPLIANVNGRTGWHGCINFDTSRIFGTPSYYAQKLFSRNCPSYTVASQLNYQVVNPEKVKGRIGFSFSKATGAVKEVRVEKDGQTLYASDFSHGGEGWDTAPGWKVQDGALVFTGDAAAMHGDPAWTDYSVSAKVRLDNVSDPKEGAFVTHIASTKEMDIGFRILGGGTNSVVYGCDGTYGEKPVAIELGRWHDIKVAVHGMQLQAWVDNRLVQDVNLRVLHKLATGAGIDEATGEMVIKLVNTHPEPITTTVNLEGLPRLSRKVSASVLKGDTLQARNSLDEPQKVVPVDSTFPINGPKFDYAAPACSLTVLRIGTR